MGLTKKQELIKEYIELSTKKMLKESSNSDIPLLTKAQALDFQTEEEYFEYIVDSITNGQIKQAKELYNDISLKDQESFVHWFETAYHYEALDNDESTNKIFDILGISGNEDDSEDLDEISLAGLGNIGKKILNKTVDAGKKVYDKASDKADQFVDGTRAKFDQGVDKVVDKAKEVGAGISREYNKGVASDTEKKLYVQMEKVKQIIIKYNETAKKAGIPLINPRKMMGVLNTIKI